MRQSDIRWGIPVSIGFHVALILVFIFGLPVELPKPPQEEAVAVAIVDPPEPEPETEPEPEPEAAPEPEREPEPAPEVPEPEAPAEPKPAAEPASEPEQTAEIPPADLNEIQPPIPVLRPVFEFGEETTGPRASPDGNASMEGTTRPQEEETEEPSGTQMETPEILSSPLDADDDGAAMSDPASPDDEAQDIEETDTEVEEILPTLPEAKTLFSEDMTNDVVARIAMGDLPRSLRATQLCETELTEQLRHASPPRNPDFIPRSPLSEGTVLELRTTAFRAEGRWFDLSFRCEINGDATKVVSFAFDIGDPVPRNEWKRRGFPGS